LSIGIRSGRSDSSGVSGRTITGSASVLPKPQTQSLRYSATRYDPTGPKVLCEPSVALGQKNPWGVWECPLHALAG
ncbi:MAG: hypothetical protein ABGY42_06090, partial [bacterium]